MSSLRWNRFQKPEEMPDRDSQEETMHDSGARGAPCISSAPASQIIVRTGKSHGYFIILGVLLGLFGVHNFYPGYYGRGALQLLIAITWGMIYVSIIITGAWVLIDLLTVRQSPPAAFSRHSEAQQARWHRKRIARPWCQFFYRCRRNQAIQACERRMHHEVTNLIPESREAAARSIGKPACHSRVVGEVPTPIAIFN